MARGLSYTVSATAHIRALPRHAYNIIADYHAGHPRILPPQFRNLTVEQGGIGDGTVIRFDVRVFGRTQRFRAIVSEPEPGRVLVERNVEPTPSITTFTVVPDGSGSRVTITTQQTTEHGGVLGAIERLLSTRVLNRMYAEELSLLDSEANKV